MAYLRCESCGAKALVAASRCPKCAHEFHLVDARGERVKLSQCRRCGIMQRRGAACHWCPPTSGTSWRSPRLIQSAAAALLVAVVGASTWTYGDRVQDLVSHGLRAGRSAITAGPSRPRAESPQEAVAPLAVALPATAGESAPGVPAPAATGSPSPNVTSASTAGVIDQPVNDPTRWVPVVARTWVNIRSGAGRSGDVVGVIKPASRAMLGTTGRAGWRQVRSGDTTGWVDSRLFEADSLGSRG